MSKDKAELITELADAIGLRYLSLIFDESDSTVIGAILGREEDFVISGSKFLTKEYYDSSFESFSRKLPN